MNTSISGSTAQPGDQRRNPWGILRRVCLGLAFLAVAIGLFYGVENWRGWRAWTAERAEVLKNNTPLEWAEIVPPTVPDDQNLANTEPFLLLFDWKRGANGQLRNTNLPAGQAWCDLSSIHGRSSQPGLGYWAGLLMGDAVSNAMINLQEWQHYFRSPVSYVRPHVAEARRRHGLAVPEVLPRGADARPTNGPPGYPLPLVPGDPAEDVLLALKVFDHELATVAAGARRPHARLPIRYEDGLSALLPHLGTVKQMTSVFTLRALARLEANQAEGALDDLRTALRLAEVAAEEPLLISQLVRYACLTIALQTAWEGQLRHQWSASQLTDLQDRLASIDVLPGMQRALAGERIMVQGALRTILRSAEGRRELEGMFDALSSDQQVDDMRPLLALKYFAWAPRGWLYASNAEISRTLRMLETASPAELILLEKTWPPAPPGSSLRYGLYRVHLRSNAPKMVHAVLKAHRAQAQVRLAQTACALERHRIDIGSYPERLETLVPRWLEVLPVDPMDQQPLRYARVGADRFRLWSIGGNAKDDGGDLAQAAEVPLRSLDWVWAWPSP
jgi:hypothetical protein